MTSETDQKSFKDQIIALKKHYDNELKLIRTEFNGKVDVLYNVIKDKDEVIGNLNKEIGELKNTCSFLTEETTVLKGHIKTHDISIKSNSKKNDELKTKSIDLEDRSRRNNLVFFNIPENNDQGNGFEDCEGMILKILEDKKYFDSSYNLQINRAHRLGRKNANTNARPRPIIVRFTYFKDKQFIIQNGRRFKDSIVNVSEDYSKATIFEHSELRKHAKEAKQAQFNDPAKAILNFKITYKRVVLTYTTNKLNSSAQTFTKAYTLQNIIDNPTT